MAKKKFPRHYLTLKPFSILRRGKSKNSCNATKKIFSFVKNTLIMFIKFVIISLFMLASSTFLHAQSVQTLSLDAFVGQYNKSAKKTLLDVRTPEEWAKGKIPSSKCINIKEANFMAEVNKLDKNLPIFVYCAAGVRSASASKKLQDAGFKTIFNLSAAGYADLAAKGLR